MTRQPLRGDARLPLRQQRLRPLPRRHSRGFAVLAYVTLGLLGLGAAAVAVAALAPPLGAVRDRVIAQVQERTGRTLTVAGPMSISLLPRPVVTLEGVALLPPEGMTSGPTVTVPALEAEVGFWSLLSRRPKLEQLTLHEPTIDLIVDAQGRRSWDADRRPRSAQASSAPKAADPRPRQPRPLVVRVEGGTVRYRDERSGTRYEIDAVDLVWTTAAADAALSVAGGFTLDGVPFRFSVSAPKEANDAVVIKLVGAPLDLTYEGSLAVQGGVAAEGRLSVAQLAYKNLKLGPAHLAVSVAGGSANVAVEEIALYGGRGAGSVTFDGTGPTPMLSANFKLTNLSLLPLLKDAAGAGWLDGRANLDLALKGHGVTEREIVDSLAGQLQLAVVDGGITGFDVERVLRAIQRGRLDRLAPRRDDRTPFSALTGAFDIERGVAKTTDLKLVSKHVELKGEGQVELGPRRIDATLLTKIDGGAPAEGAVVRIGTVELPIAIKGALDRPDFTIKGQEALSDAIGRIGKNLKSREMQDAIDGALSGDRSKRVKPAELLEKLLKKE